MKKPEYLALPHVLAFSDYLRTFLGGRPFPHRFTFLKSGQSWDCISIQEALAKYQWPIRKEFAAIAAGAGFQENKQVLAAFSQSLRAAFAAGDSAALADAAKRVMKWGGTEKGNNEALSQLANAGTTVSYFQKAEQVFGQDALNEAALRDDSIRSNAGFTKIYSLLRDDFIIYDSRVAAALALLVIAYCKENRITQIPAGLAFRVMPAKEAAGAAYRKLRRPVLGELTFAGVNNSHLAHARSNVMANWVLAEALRGTCFHAAPPAEDLRAVEAALFMIGYDLSCSPILVA